MLRDRIRNECIFKNLKLLLSSILRENQLRWFIHVQWRLISALVRRSYGIIVSGDK